MSKITFDEAIKAVTEAKRFDATRYDNDGHSTFKRRFSTLTDCVDFCEAHGILHLTALLDDEVKVRIPRDYWRKLTPGRMPKKRQWSRKVDVPEFIDRKTETRRKHEYKNQRVAMSEKIARLRKLREGG